MKISRPVAFGMGVIMTLVIGSGTAYAATGGKFILGKSNSAGKTSTLTNKHGTALSLNSRAGTPSLKVNRTTKVPNLNADLIDGLDSTKLALASGSVKAYDVDGVAFDFDQDTLIDTIIASGQCPSGTRRTGGGSGNFTQTGFTLFDGPDVNNSWSVVVAVDENTVEDPTDVFASIVCYSPRGVPSGGYRTTQSDIAATPSAALIAKAREAVGRANR